MSTYRFPCSDGLTVEVRALQNGIFRITGHGLDSPDPSLLERYGIVEEIPEDSTACCQARTVTLGESSLEVLPDGGWILRKAGRIVAETAEGTRPATALTEKQNAGWTLRLKSAPGGTQYLGLGDVQRQQIALNGLSGELWIMPPKCHIPVPFFMTSEGLGVFFNTTRSVYFDVCKTDPEHAVFGCRHAFFDAWVFAGESYYDLLNRYTMLSGRPHLPPVKTFGLWLTVYYYSTVNELHMIACALRDKKIPCDNLALDPGWMEKDYDQTIHRDWDRVRFNPSPLELWRGPAQEMIKVLGTLGYNVGLWLCCAWDFTYEEERRLFAATSSTTDATSTGATTTESLSVPESHVTFVDTRMAAKTYLDTITQRDQPYFEHLKKLADDGVSFFKLDGCSLQNEYPDRLYGNGKTDTEMHNLAFLLESRHTFEDFEKYTQKRAYGISPSGTAGVQRYGGTWCGDTAGDHTGLTGMLQDAIVGHAFTTADVMNRTLPGVHLGTFLPWMYIDCWAICHYPGFLTEDLNNSTREYLNLRMTLIPYFYSLAWLSHTTGAPLIRPLCFDWPKEPWAYQDVGVAMLGDSILFGVDSGEKIRLPPGRWYDLWTGKIHQGNGEWQAIPFPANRGGHCMIREGALIPTIPVAQYVTPGKLDAIEWLIFPREDDEERNFTLYMDDGQSLKHREGDFAYQTFTLCRDTVTPGPIQGESPAWLSHVQHTTRILG